MELINGRVDPIPLFKLPDELPKIKDMTAYQMVLYLEQHCGFAWCRMPSKPADRAAISFRPPDRSTPRFWCTGKAKVHPMYLRALAEASAGSSLKIDEVLHAERLSYYCVLLGIEQKEKGGA